jgi:hypothetical protein
MPTLPQVGKRLFRLDILTVLPKSPRFESSVPSLDWPGFPLIGYLLIPMALSAGFAAASAF